MIALVLSLCAAAAVAVVGGVLLQSDGEASPGSVESAR